MNVSPHAAIRDIVGMEIPADLDITITDIMDCGHCARMAQFFRSNGLRSEYAEMLKGGAISARKLFSTGDPRAVNVVRRMIEKRG